MSETTDPRPRIVVGVDGSDPSKLALRWAARIAAAEGAHIEAVMAWQMPTLAYASMGPIVEMEHAMEKALLGSVSAKVAEHAQCPVLVVR